jgi:hypothetical protein
VPALPVELHFVDVALTAVTGLCLAGVAAVYPARGRAVMQPSAQVCTLECIDGRDRDVVTHGIALTR